MLGFIPDTKVQGGVPSNPAAFIGYATADAAGDPTTFDTNMVEGNLPASYSAGKYLVVITSAKDIVGVTLDGTSCVETAGTVGTPDLAHAFDVTIAGGGNGTIVVDLVGSDDEVGLAVFKIDGLSFISMLEINDANRKTDVQSTYDINTSAGNIAVASAFANKAGHNWTNLTEHFDVILGNARYGSIASNLNCAGGTPEVFTWHPSINWTSNDGIIVIYG